MGTDKKKAYKHRPVQQLFSGTVRLNKFIANAGICSRRKADELIAQGKVAVNGKVATEMWYQVKPDDEVKYRGKLVGDVKRVYVLLNKPKDFITTTKDEKGRKTVLDLVKKATSGKIYPVGRLDRNTTGLLLLTNDGELAQRLMHPSKQVRKTYLVGLEEPLSDKDMEMIAQGLKLDDGISQVDNIAYANTTDKTQIGIEIHMGKNRIIRRIFEYLGHKVKRLDRVVYAGLTKKNLPRGKWRYLTEKEAIMLKHFS